MIKKRIKTAFWIIGTLTLMSCSGGNKESGEAVNSKALNKAFIQNVKTTEAVLAYQNEELTLAGKVEYDPDKLIHYVSLVNGIAERTYFSLGDKVQKGQTLVDVRSTDLNALQSELVASESEVKIAARELQAAQAMYDDNLLSEKELMEVQARLKQKETEYLKTKSDISVHGVSNGNGTFSIKSPMTGYIVGKNVSSGSTISADSAPLFMVADLSSVWITANVYAGNLKSVNEGMEVVITSLSYPGESFSGKINTLSPVFDPEEKALKARIVMSNNDLKFKPEMSVVIRLKNQLPAQFVSVPSDALIFDDDCYFVVVKDSVNDFKVKEVKLQGHNNKTTYITTGLTEGENVVVRDQLLIYFGLKEN